MSSVTSLASIFLLFCAISNLDDKVEACSCQPIHPQAMFCRSQYVVRALVQKSRLVELRYGGKYRKIQHDDTEMVDVNDDEEEVNNTINSTDHDNKTIEATTPGYDDDDLAGFDGETPERRVDENDGERDDDEDDGDDHGEYGTNDFGPPLGDGGTETATFRPRRSIRRLRRRENRNHYRVYSPGANRPAVTPNSRIMVQYRIRIVHIYKGLQNATEQQKRFIYVPPAPLCNVELKSGGHPYIIMGDIHNDVLMHGLCDFKLDLSEITRESRRNVLQNLQERYPKSCKTCRVKVCNGYDNCNEDEVEPYSCEWKEWWTAQSAGACQYSCMQTRKGQCKWYNPLRRLEKRRRSL